MASEFAFQQATKKGTKARIAIEAPSGAGKTWTSLLLAAKLAEDGGIGLIDTENQSASKYASEFAFKSLNLRPPFAPARYINAIHAAENAGLDVLIIDSLSQEWDGAGGAREMVDRAASRFGGNKWAAWSEVTEEHNKLIQAILHSPIHVIATMRSKMETEQQTVDGRKEIVKLGMKAIQREGFEYEFDIVASLDLEHRLTVTKSRCRPLDKYRATEPDMSEFAKILKAWLGNAEPLTAADLPDLAKALGGQVTRSDMVAATRIASESKGYEGTPEREDGSVRPAPAPSGPKMPNEKGEPLSETQLKVIEEQFNVAKDIGEAKRGTMERLDSLGYNWQGFVLHGRKDYAFVLNKVKTYDRSGYVKEGTPAAEAHRAAGRSE